MDFHYTSNLLGLGLSRALPLGSAGSSIAGLQQPDLSTCQPYCYTVRASQLKYHALQVHVLLLENKHFFWATFPGSPSSGSWVWCSTRFGSLEFEQSYVLATLLQSIRQEYLATVYPTQAGSIARTYPAPFTPPFIFRPSSYLIPTHMVFSTVCITLMGRYFWLTAPTLNGPPELSLLDDPNADTALHSCDLQEFRVPKYYLIKDFPVFSELIQSAAIDSSTPLYAGAHPYIQLSESGTILSCLLSFILPVPSILPPATEQIMELLSVAQKRQMNSTLAQIRGAVALQDPPFICTETAFHIYSLVQRYGLAL
jgi:hypothetical protein